MDDKKYLQTESDFDVEIINLPPLDHDADSQHPSAHMPSYSSLKPRFSTRQRHLQLLITASIVVITLVVLPGSSMSVGNLAARLLTVSAPTPTVTLAPGVD